MNNPLIQPQFYLMLGLLLGLFACTSPESPPPNLQVQPSPPIKLSGEGEKPTKAETKVPTTLVQLKFDLHDLGGLAPDCYVTEVAFELPYAEGQPQYPKVLPFKERETGCVPEEWQFSGTFVKALENTEQVWYQFENTETDQERLLLLVKTPKTGEDSALYWAEGPFDAILGQSMEALQTLEEEDQVPYRISQSSQDQ